MKEWMAAGVDEIPSEMLKSLEEKATLKLCVICKDMHEKGKWPVDFTRTFQHHDTFANKK